MRMTRAYACWSGVRTLLWNTHMAADLLDLGQFKCDLSILRLLSVNVMMIYGVYLASNSHKQHNGGQWFPGLQKEMITTVFCVLKIWHAISMLRIVYTVWQTVQKFGVNIQMKIDNRQKCTVHCWNEGEKVADFQHIPISAWKLSPALWTIKLLSYEKQLTCLIYMYPIKTQ